MDNVQKGIPLGEILRYKKAYKAFLDVQRTTLIMAREQRRKLICKHCGRVATIPLEPVTKEKIVYCKNPECKEPLFKLLPNGGSK